MSLNLRLGILIVALVLLITILQNLKKGRIPIKYSILWILSVVLLTLVSIVPELFVAVSSLIGFITMSNMIIGIFIFLILIITMALTIIVSGQKNQIVLLIQEVSLLKEKLNNDK